MGRKACTEPQCLYNKGLTLIPLWGLHSFQCLRACRVQLKPNSVYLPYSIYRASLPVFYSYNETPLMGLDSVNSLIA